MGRLAGKLTAEQHERLVNALGAEMTAMARRADDAPETVEGAVPVVAMDEHLAAQALVNRVTATPVGGDGAGGGGRAAITIVVDAQTASRRPRPGDPGDASPQVGLCETGTGGPLSWEAFNRCACDAVIRRVVLDDRGVPIDVGRAYRTATPAQWAGLTAIYTGCAWYGCDRPLAWCQAHHIIYWDDLGPTDLENLVPLCSRHHHLAHEGGWRLMLSDDRQLHHHQPDGTLWRISRPDRRHECLSHTDIDRRHDCLSETDSDRRHDCLSDTDSGLHCEVLPARL
jgi:hypothetical protein